MEFYSRTHLADSTLESNLPSKFHNEDVATADLLADLAEFDERKLYVRAGYTSLLSYCVGKLGRTDDSARRRIHTARAARSFPAIFGMLRDGHLCLSTIMLLAPHLRPENAAELLAAAAGKWKSEIERLLAARFPKTEFIPMITALPISEPVPVASASAPA